METSSGSEARDLLNRPDETPTESPVVQKDPDMQYKQKITDAVKRHLNVYYGGEERFDKAGNPNEILCIHVAQRATKLREVKVRGRKKSDILGFWLFFI